jgi:hypothetical protein
VKDLKESIKRHRSGCEEHMRSWAEYSVDIEKQRYVEHKKFRMATRVKFRNDKDTRRSRLQKEEESYKKEQRVSERLDGCCMKQIVENSDKEQDKMEANLQEIENELADVIELQQSAQRIVDQKRDEALRGWAEEKATRIAMAEGRWYRYEE